MNRSRLLILPLVLTMLACLEGERVNAPTRNCTCSGMRCKDSVVNRLTNATDEYSDPCLGCHYVYVGRCAEGCSEAEPVDGCFIAQHCRTWTRVEPGSACQTDRDCEPGLSDGVAANTLVCGQDQRCVASSTKWPAETPKARVCTGDPQFGPHPQCGAAPCLTTEAYGKTRYCSVAKCLDDGDCPTNWRCRCQEETTTTGARAHRWCVPGPDFPEEAVVPL